MSLRFACRLALVAVLALESGAFAQGAAQGEALFKQGMELRAAGKLAEACQAFDASQKADPNLGTLIRLADCREANNELASAWSAFLQAEQQTRGATDDEGTQIHSVAQTRAAALEPRLSKVILLVPDASRAPGLEVRIGETVYASSSWNLELPIDGKTHTISARAPGRIEWTTTITVAPERDHGTVSIPPLEKAPEPPKPVERVVIVERAPEGPSLVMKVLPYALVVAGVASIGGAIYFESTSRDALHTSEGLADDFLQEAYWERAKKQRYKAIGFGLGGLACGAVATWLWLRGDPEEPPPRKTVQPVVGQSFTGITVGGAW